MLGERFGNVFVGIQPGMGHEGDPMRLAGRLDKLSVDVARSLTVAATPLVCSSVMPVVLKNLQAAQPGMHVQSARPWTEARSKRWCSRVRSTWRWASSSRRARAMRRQRLLSLPLVCVSPREWPGAGSGLKRLQRSHVSWSDLAEVPLIGLPVGNPIQQLIDLRLREMGRANEARTTFNHLHSVVAMVEAGYGAAVMPAFVQGACSRYAVHVSVMTAPEVPLDFYAPVPQRHPHHRGRPSVPGRVHRAASRIPPTPTLRRPP